MNQFVPAALRAPLTLIVISLFSRVALAQDAPPEPRETEAPPSVLVVPMPNKAPAAAQVPIAQPGTTSSQNASNPADTDAAPDADVVEAIPGDPWGDADGLNMIALRALFQTRYTSTWAESSDNVRASYREREDWLATEGDGWSLQRMFVRLSSDPVKYVGFKAVFDFAELIVGDPEDVVKQVYSTIRPIPGRLELVVGQFKMPFSIFELDPTARFEFARFGPANQLLNDLGFAGRSFGLQLIGSPLPKAKRLQISIGAFQGHAKDEHASPVGALAGRIEYKPKKWLRLGFNANGHPFAFTYNRPFNTSDKDVLPNPPDPLYPAQKRWGRGGAYGIDARFKKKGFMFRTEAVYGDRVDIDTRYGASKFWSAWGIAAYGFDVGPVVKLLPAIRAEWLDSDSGHGKGLHQTFSGSFTVIAWQRVRFLLDGTYTWVEPNTPLLNQPKPLQADPYLALSNFKLTGQLQLEL